MFRVLDEKPAHKHVLRRQMAEIGNLTSCYPVALGASYLNGLRHSLNRRQQVNGECSETSGVPQGSSGRCYLCYISTICLPQLSVR